MSPSFARLLKQAIARVHAGRWRDAALALRIALLGKVAQPAPTFTSASHSDAAGERDYMLFVPSHREGERLPLVVMLHGCSQDPADFALGTGMNEIAQRLGVVVLYPAQTAQANAFRCWNWFKHNHQQRDRGEPAILAGMTAAVMRTHAVDPRRVYVAGLSAGGAMAAILGNAYPELFAAVGVHSGLAAGAASDMLSALAVMKGQTAAAMPESPQPPTIVFHGDQDSTVHPINGEHAAAAAARDATSDPQRDQGDQGEHGWPYTRQRYRDRAGRVVVDHWLIHGAGHAWSGGNAKGSFADARGPNASAEMLRFFAMHSLQELD